MHYISSKENVPVIFLIHPIFEKHGFEKYSLAGVHKNLANEAFKNNLMVFDLLDEYKKYNSEEIKIDVKGWFDPWHPNAKGHEITAECLYERVLTYKDKKE